MIVRAYDGRSYGMAEEPLVVMVSQVNEAPVITTKSRTEFSLRENFIAVLYTYRATDQDADDAITWSVEGTDGGDFRHLQRRSHLPPVAGPRDSGRRRRRQRVRDHRGGLRPGRPAGHRRRRHHHHGPGRGAGDSRQDLLHHYAENYDITQVLGSYTATDAKDNRTVYPTWSLSGRDGGDFVIDKGSGVLSFRNTPDYDRPADSNRDNIYEVTIRAHDSRAYGYLARDGNGHQRQ